jgi:ADP-heptose:LPS heptosyltransferase
LTLPRVRLDEQGLEAKAALMRAARLVVSVDTSVMHLAVGCGVTTLCLASAAHVIDSVPYDPRMTPDNVTFLYHDLPCRGCLGQCILPLEEGMYPCVARLDIEAVLAKVTGELRGGNKA